ncbi:MAG: thiaminase II [Opitutales bacterium]|nr:thiaminase II [Opitutales bacterium]
MSRELPFRDQLWADITPIYASIRAHPFLRGLTSGELPEEAFRFYVEQDALYLKSFGQGLALLGARSPDMETMRMFADHAANTVAVERALHAGFMEGWKRAVDEDPEPAPTCLHYTSYLLRTVYHRPFAEAVAAFLPCYWIYLKVGLDLQPEGSPHPLYQRWIDTYAGEAFGTVVEQVLSLTDQLGAQADAQTVRAMRANFRQGARFEYMFWDMAWRKEAWPV